VNSIDDHGFKKHKVIMKQAGMYKVIRKQAGMTIDDHGFTV
jgi:hypothetical protein